MNIPGRMNPSALLLLGMVAAAILLFSGCSRWKTRSTDTPWVAPNKQAVEQTKRHRGYVGSTYEFRWIGPDNRIYSPDTIANEAEQFLISTSSETNSGSVLDPTTWPWKTIVSLSPSVVLLVPSDPVKAKMGHLLGKNNSTADFGDFANATGYEAGSVVLYNDGVYWFSPDMQSKPQPVVFTDGTAEIQLPDGKLELSVEGEVCRIRRK